MFRIPARSSEYLISAIKRRISNLGIDIVSVHTIPDTGKVLYNLAPSKCKQNGVGGNIHRQQQIILKA